MALQIVKVKLTGDSPQTVRVSLGDEPLVDLVIEFDADDDGDDEAGEAADDDESGLPGQVSRDPVTN